MENLFEYYMIEDELKEETINEETLILEGKILDFIKGISNKLNKYIQGIDSNETTQVLTQAIKNKIEHIPADQQGSFKTVFGNMPQRPSDETYVDISGNLLGVPYLTFSSSLKSS